jgi:hypothetical protein
MRFQKFEEFLKEREVTELAAAPAIGIPNDKLNRTAFAQDQERVIFNNRFPDPKEGEHIIKLAGYRSVAEFLQNPDPRKWSRLKIPGQENYRDGPVDDKKM